METALTHLAASPKLVLYLREIERMLADEQRNRERFYNTITEQQKAEFINGEMIMHSPVKKMHNDACSLLLNLVANYVRVHQLGFVGFEKILIALTRNDYEPDVCFFGQHKARTFTPDQMKFPAPDFIAEILSPSTEANDRGVKFEDYAAHGVQEYWLLDPQTATIEQYHLVDGAYQLVLKSNNGTVTSIAIAGFVVAVRALFDEQENLRALQALLAAPSSASNLPVAS
jgi:Uma2 family endonuclease